MTVQFRHDHDVNLIDWVGGDDQVCMSAWVSFGIDDEERLLDRNRVEKLINFLYRNQHMTPFESTVFTFRLATPIFVTREIQRHRSASYNEWSGRYAEMIPSFYLPRETRPLIQQGKPGQYHFVRGSEAQYSVVVDKQTPVVEHAWRAYQEQLEAGIAKEVARNILPLNTYTYFYMTMNARNLMHFLKLRTDPTALQEIQELAGQVEEIFKTKMPLTYKAYKGEE